MSEKITCATKRRGDGVGKGPRFRKKSENQRKEEKKETTEEEEGRSREVEGEKKVKEGVIELGLTDSHLIDTEKFPCCRQVRSLRVAVLAPGVRSRGSSL